MQTLAAAPQREDKRIQGQERIHQRFRWLTQIDYHATRLHWIECLETVTTDKQQVTTRFVHLTNLEPDSACVAALSRAGRLRWKIENEGLCARKIMAMPWNTSMPEPVGWPQKTIINACKSHTSSISYWS